MNLRAEDFYTQRNNEWDDLNTPYHESVAGCGPSFRAMFYQGNNLPFKNNSFSIMGEHLSDDDFIMYLMRTPEAFEYAEKHFPVLAKDYPPNEIHDMYPNWLDVKLFGQRVSDFHNDGLTYEYAITLINEGKIIGVTGKYPEANINGHFQGFAGIHDGVLLLVDPYGDYRNNYKPVTYVKGKPKYGGFGIPMSEEDFDKHLKWGVTKAYHEPII